MAKIASINSIQVRNNIHKTLTPPIKNINIPKNEFYNSLDFINLLSGLLNLILEHSIVHFSLEDKEAFESK